MELTYPWIITIGASLLVLIIILFVILKPKESDPYKEGKKVANTKYIKSLPYYKKLLIIHKVLSWSLVGLCVLCICFSLVLMARPAQAETVSTTSYSRDIFLCLDVSSSLDDVNDKLVERVKELVKSLKGERFGISIFNTSSVLLIPLTDDYDSVLEVLDSISKSLNSPYYGQRSTYADPYIASGVILNYEVRGSSIIGEGLASCIFSFPNLEEDRTRIIIFSTDNQLECKDTPIVTLQEAAEIAKSRDITVYGIAPRTLGGKDLSVKQEYQTAIETTGGTLYIENTSTKMTDIINDIEKKEKTLYEVQTETKKTDKPEAPFIGLLISLLILFALSKKVNI